MAKSREYYRRKLLRCYRKALAEVEQIIRDLEWWNENRTDEQPFDVGADKVAASILREIISLLEANENIPSSLTERLYEQLGGTVEGR